MHNHYNRYSYVLNNPLKYTDPSGWKYFYKNREPRVPREDMPYGWNGITDYISNTGSNYNYMGSFSMYMNNPEQYNYTYGTQTWMQTATQNPSSYFSVNSNSIYTNNPQKIGSILNNISRGGTVSEIFELYGGTAPGITIYSTATGFITNQSSIQNTYNWIQNSLNGIGNTQSGWDLHNISQDFRKGAGFANTIVQPFAQAWSRANTYGTPLKGGTTLVWLEKGIKNFKIRTPAIELSTKTVGQISSTLSKVRYTAGFAGMFFGGADIIYNGFSISNTLDFTMSGLALTGFGSGLAMGYFYTNTALQITTGKDIGQHIGSFLKP